MKIAALLHISPARARPDNTPQFRRAVPKTRRSGQTKALAARKTREDLCGCDSEWRAEVRRELFILARLHLQEQEVIRRSLSTPPPTPTPTPGACQPSVLTSHNPASGRGECFQKKHAHNGLLTAILNTCTVTLPALKIHFRCSGVRSAAEPGVSRLGPITQALMHFLHLGRTT